MSDAPAAALLVSLAAAAGGLAAVVLALVRPRRPALDLGEYLQPERADVNADELQRVLAEPFRRRVVRAQLDQALSRVGRLTPRSYLESVHRKLVMAGLATTTPPERFVATQAALAGVLAVGAVAFVLVARPPLRLTVSVLVLLPLAGLLLPSARLNHRVAERQQGILRDLPDTLDLLAISVEAGMGFEGALDVVCRHFRSSLAEEFALTLREMELGLPRRDAFQNLKARTEVPELSSFILALLQGDALGIPVGRVLKTQAVEMRSKRRMWAREKAGKLPVKILLPLVLFIFPPILAVVLTPAALSIRGGGL